MPDIETEIALIKQEIEHLDGWIKDWLRRVASDRESEKDRIRDQSKKISDLEKEIALLKQNKDSNKSIWDRVLTAIGFILAVISIIIQIIKSQ